ncbi:MAG: hypothetical protein DI539_21240 [Flavobacterium psychrophilum]|nr:MAG: hypothetical protein DI539_21240 [Flavobacterium psychrophilum]
MTLVIARKIKNVISFSSDSRIKFGDQGFIDFGIKIFPIPVKIYSPTDKATGKTDLDYDYNLGLAVVGSSINAYTIKDSVTEILQNIQHVPGYTDLSMDGISKLVFKIFEMSTKELMAILQKQGLCQLILGGYCPIKKRIRVFLFSIDDSTLPVTPIFSEILQEDDTLFFGSGKTLAEQIYLSGTKGSLHIIREVIKGGKIDSVGGGLQYGEFDGNQFRVYGVTDYARYDDGSFKEYLYTLRGINLYKDEFERESDGFHIAYSFKTPFENEIWNR